MRFAASIVTLALALLASPLQAQEKNSFAVGVNFTHRLANDDDSHGNGGVGLSWRVGHSKQGWGWTYGLGWFVSDLERTVSGQRLPFGELKVRPIVGGYGYTHQISNRWFVTGDLVGGFAFTTFSLTPEAATTLAAAAHAERVDADSSFIPIVRPEVRTWYDINNRWGLTVGAWYAFARPNVTVTTATARDTLHIRADTFSLSTGIVYRIF